MMDKGKDYPQYSIIHAVDELEYIQIKKLLCDDVRQLLYSIILGCQAEELQNLDADSNQYIHDLKNTASALFVQICNIASEPDYHFLTLFGFLPTITKWIENFTEQHGFRMLIEVEGIKEEERFHESEEKLIFSLCKEWIILFSQHAEHEQPLSIKIIKRQFELQLLMRSLKPCAAIMLMNSPSINRMNCSASNLSSGSIQFILEVGAGVLIDAIYDLRIKNE